MALILNEEIYQEFKTALAKGRWSSDMPMTDWQKCICSEVIAIRERHSHHHSGTQMEDSGLCQPFPAHTSYSLLTH